MNEIGLSQYNAGTSLDLDTLKKASANNSRQNSDHESDDGDEEETQKRNAEVIMFWKYFYILYVTWINFLNDYSCKMSYKLPLTILLMMKANLKTLQMKHNILNLDLNDCNLKK